MQVLDLDADIVLQVVDPASLWDADILLLVLDAASCPAYKGFPVPEFVF